MQDIIYWLWLSRININSKIKKDLILKYISPKTIWNLTKKNLEEDNIDEQYIKEILEEEYRKNLKQYENYILKNNIKIINIFSKEYPNKLKNIYDSPVILFYKGNIDLINKKSIGIVGSRCCSEYGKKICTEFATKLSSNNICIISGLARGIDTFAHNGSYNKKGKTIAVIGCGLDITYPEENINLSNKILENNGLIISEYIVGTKPNSINFPKRNRIISGLSDGILVIEASKHSGALITVEFALEHGKEVYAVPGNINSYNSYGTNDLIKQGAKLATNINDILEDYKN